MSTVRGETSGSFSGLLGTLKGAALNSTSDQAIPLSAGTTTYIVRRIIVTNASGTPVLASGGVYTAAAKGGSAIVANSQVFTALDAAAKALDLTLAITGQTFTASPLYFSLTVANAAAVTVDIYIFGDILE